MADVRLTVEQVVRSGLAASYNGSLSVSDQYLVANNGRMLLHFLKTGAGDCTVTVVTPGTVDGLAVADRTFVVPATTGDLFVGPWPANMYHAPGENDVKFTLSEITGLTVACLRV